MDREQRLQRAVYDGDQAKQVLENEAFQQAFADIEQEITEAWKTSPQRDAEGREKLFLALTMLSKMQQALTKSLESGKLALVELNHQNPTMQQEARRFLGMES